MARSQTGWQARLRRSLRRGAGQILSLTYPTAKAYYHLVIRFAYPRGGAPILVYQMGKVGSQSVHRSLTRLDLPNPVFHIHSLAQEAIRREEEGSRRGWDRSRAGYAVHVWQSQHVRRRLPALERGERWRVITLTRDPVARNVSSFFQIGQAQSLLGLSRTGPLPPVADETVERLGDLFLERFSGHEAPLTWFDDELKAVLGFDAYATPFPTPNGYAIYKGDRVDVLVLRVEDLRACAEQALREFLGLEHFELVDANTAEEKNYSALYRRFVQTVDLPESYLSRMYDSKYARHFYTEVELAAFRSSWERAGTPDVRSGRGRGGS